MDAENQSFHRASETLEHLAKRFLSLIYEDDPTRQKEKNLRLNTAYTLTSVNNKDFEDEITRWFPGKVHFTEITNNMGFTTEVDVPTFLNYLHRNYPLEAVGF